MFQAPSIPCRLPARLPVFTPRTLSEAPVGPKMTGSNPLILHRSTESYIQKSREAFKPNKKHSKKQKCARMSHKATHTHGKPKEPLRTQGYRTSPNKTTGNTKQQEKQSSRLSLGRRAGAHPNPSAPLSPLPTPCGSSLPRQLSDHASYRAHIGLV